MAYVTSMTYTTEAQFMEAVAQAKAAQNTRQSAQAAANAQASSISFHSILNNSIAEQSGISSYGASESAYDNYFQKAADTYGVPVALLKAVAKQESAFQANIVSSAGAVGVMQLMPSTARYLGVSDPYNPEQNIMGGAKLLAELSQRYNGDIDRILAAYNAGAGAVDQYNGIPPYSETQNFVVKVKANIALYQ